MKIRERIKELGIKPIDISRVTGISRVMIYEYFERYDNGNTKGLRKDILELLKEISKAKDYYKALEVILKYHKGKHY